MLQVTEEQSEFDPYPELDGELLEKAIRQNVSWAISILDSDARHFARHMNNVLEQDTWRRVAKTWGEFCQKFVGMDETLVGAIVAGVEALGYEVPIPVERALGKWGRPRKGEEKGDNITFTRGTTGAAYLLARLRRDAPEIADQYDAGEFRSVRAAAIAAGIIKPMTPLSRVQSAWRAASQEEREQIASWIDEQMSPLKNTRIQ